MMHNPPEREAVITTKEGWRFKLKDDGYRVYAEKLSTNPINVVAEDEDNCVFEYKHSGYPCADSICERIMNILKEAEAPMEECIAGAPLELYQKIRAILIHCNRYDEERVTYNEAVLKILRLVLTEEYQGALTACILFATAHGEGDSRTVELIKQMLGEEQKKQERLAQAGDDQQYLFHVEGKKIDLAKEVDEMAFERHVSWGAGGSEFCNKYSFWRCPYLRCKQAREIVEALAPGFYEGVSR